MNESDLFYPIRDRYLEMGCEVFSEVRADGLKRADVVAKDKNIITVIELKKTFSLELLEQCSHWIGRANYVYACVLSPKRKPISRFVQQLLRKEGIGLLTISFLDKQWQEYLVENNIEVVHSITEVIEPRLYRRISCDWNRYLTEAHKNTLPGGSKGGGYLTPYRIMMNNIKDYLKQNPEGVPYKSLVIYGETHYANPKQSLMQALLKFEKNWCEVYRKDKTTYCRIKK